MARARNGGGKRDANHSTIVGAFEDMKCGVIDLADLGRGRPDILVWVRGAWHLIEIKNPETGYGKRGANKLQIDWAEKWVAPVYLIYSVEEVADFVAGRIDNIKTIKGVK